MKVSNILGFLNKTVLLKIRNLDVSPTYWQVFLIIILLFLLVITLARVRHLYVHWSLGKSSMSMFFWGFFLAIIIEGFLIISGKTVITSVLGWKSAPKPISTALDLGRSKLINVLGVSDELSQNQAKMSISDQQLNSMVDNLSKEQMENLYQLICK